MTGDLIGHARQTAAADVAGACAPAPTAARSPRVFHVLSCMDRGGIETWLMHVQRAITPQQWRVAYVTSVHKPAYFDEEIRSLGGEIIPGPKPTRRHAVAYVRQLRRLLAREKPDVVHSHIGLFSGLVLWVAARAGIETRIAHSHNAGLERQARARPAGGLYIKLARRLIRRYATHVFASSTLAAEALLGERWAAEPRLRILPYGVDFPAVCSAPAVSKSELALSDSVFVVGHVGNFKAEKNHGFMLCVLRALVSQDVDAHFVFVGGGASSASISQEARELGLEARTHFLGQRSDVAGLMAGAFDAFCFPSTAEGLGIALLEAQAAGLFSVCSTAVPAEATVIPELVCRLGLQEDPSRWASALLEGPSHRMRRLETEPRMTQSEFAIDRCLATLRSAYGAHSPGAA
ncbi:MAG: glycosyltransferase [Acidimicrobiales bacterium]